MRRKGDLGSRRRGTSGHDIFRSGGSQNRGSAECEGLNLIRNANQLLSQTFTIKLAWCMINLMWKLVLWVVKVYNRSFSWQSRQNWTWLSAIKCWSIQTFPFLMTHYNVLVIPIIGEGNGNVYWWKWPLTAACVHSMHIIFCNLPIDNQGNGKGQYFLLFCTKQIRKARDL